MPDVDDASPPGGEPHARGSIIHGFRAALVDLWGEDAARRGGGAAARWRPGSRQSTPLVLPFEWVPLEHVIAWHDALWTGPCAADEHALARFIGRSIELGFGRFKSAFFRNVTPERLVSRAQELWRCQHTHGELFAIVDGRAARRHAQGSPVRRGSRPRAA